MVSLIPSESINLRMVSYRGLAPGVSALYKLSRPKPAALAMCVIPRARATSLSAEMNTSGLGSSNAAARYSVQCASLFRYSTASNGAYWVIEYSPDQAHAPSRGLREYPVFGWIYFRLEAAHRPANRGECSTSDNQGRNESASQKRLLQWVPNPRSCRIRLT